MGCIIILTPPALPPPGNLELERWQDRGNRLQGEAMAKRNVGTYVYCLVAARHAPRIAPGLTRPAGLGPVRLLATAATEWLAVSDAPLSKYNEAAIHSRLGDLDAVARAAVAHEDVVESFIDAPAVLPMKLFTIFASDDRAVQHVAHNRRQIEALLRRVRNHHEWGVRVILDRRAAVGRLAAHDARLFRGQEAARGQRPTRGQRAASGQRAATGGSDRRHDVSGLAYLAAKKARRDAAAELAHHARETVTAVFDGLSRYATTARRKSAGELPAGGGPLVLDAAFLVPRSKTVRFRAHAARTARTIEPSGYHMTLTGPWPPYTFIQDGPGGKEA